MAAAALSLNHPVFRPVLELEPQRYFAHRRRRQWSGGAAPRRAVTMAAGSRSDDASPAPSEMSLENALKLLGVSEGASFDDILRAKNSVLDSCKNDQDAVAKVCLKDILIELTINSMD
jgi:DnaJ-domain-containing protein 1